MISRTAEHALRAVLFLARHTETGPVPVEVIAEALGAPRNYLSKTLHQLAKRHLVASQRGPNGGFQLAVPADRLTVMDVVEAFDEPRSGAICLLGGRPCSQEAPCAAHARWTAVTAATRAPLTGTTIADLLGQDPLGPGLLGPYRHGLHARPPLPADVVAAATAAAPLVSH